MRLPATATPMYSTCLFCQRDLGRNEVIEAFPVGRRLAFDAATGRLWVLCRRCGRWNLTPLEERWEAIEESERLFRSTRLRVATDQIGLARLRDGTELVRIGRPERCEMAAWRYGDQLGRRHRRYWIEAGVVAAFNVGSQWIAPILTGAGVPTSLLLVGAVAASLYGRQRRVGVATLPGEPKPLLFRRADVKHAELIRHKDGEWRLRVRARQARDAVRWWQSDHCRVDCTLQGDAAIRAAAAVLPTLNEQSGNRAEVREAVAMLEGRQSPAGVFSRAARALRLRNGVAYVERLNELPLPTRLALEMASHEEQERRAMEGELAELEHAWRAADEIARIADDLLVPASVRQTLARLRGERSA